MLWQRFHHKGIPAYLAKPEPFSPNFWRQNLHNNLIESAQKAGKEVRSYRQQLFFNKFYRVVICELLKILTVLTTHEMELIFDAIASMMEVRSSLNLKRGATMSQFRNAIIIIVLLLPAQLLANNTQTGMGAVIGSTSGLFLPIAAGELFIEPSVSFRKNETDSTTISNIARSGRKSRTVTLGVGLFKNKLVAEKVFLYYGARIGLVKRKITETTAPTSILSASSSTISDDGFFISPTVGAQYYFVPQFSAGLDLALQFSKTDGKEALTAGGITVTANTKDTSSSTTATVIVRYLF